MKKTIFVLLAVLLLTGAVLGDPLPPINVETYGLETHLLYSQFGQDVENWTPEQVEQANGFLACIDTLTEASVNPPHARIVVRCWQYAGFDL